LYEITDIIALSSILHKENLLNDELFEQIKNK